MPKPSIFATDNIVTKASPPWRLSLRLIAPLVAFKLLIFWIIYASLRLIPIPINAESYRVNFHWPADEPITMATAYKTWDAQHYLFISQNGYSGGEGCFYPLWPGVIHVTSFFADPLTASLIAANLLSLAALILLHRLALIEDGLDAADTAVLLALVFPSAFFLCLPYTEALFLFLVVGLFLAMRRDRPVAIWICAALLPLARSVGCVLIAPIVLDQLLKRRLGRAVLLGTGSLAGLLAYLIVFKIDTGDAFYGFRSMLGQTHASLAMLFHPVQFLGIFFAGNVELHGVLNSGIDRTVFVVVLASFVPMIRRRPVQAAYCIPAAIIPAVTLTMMSFTRFALVLFPVYFVGARLLSPPQRRWWLWIICGVSFSLQMLLLIRHVHFDWAG